MEIKKWSQITREIKAAIISASAIAVIGISTGIGFAVETEVHIDSVVMDPVVSGSSYLQYYQTVSATGGWSNKKQHAVAKYNGQTCEGKYDDVVWTIILTEGPQNYKSNKAPAWLDASNKGFVNNDIFLSFNSLKFDSKESPYGVYTFNLEVTSKWASEYFDFMPFIITLTQ